MRGQLCCCWVKWDAAEAGSAISKAFCRIGGASLPKDRQGKVREKGTFPCTQTRIWTPNCGLKPSWSCSEPTLTLRLCTGEERSIVHAGKVSQRGPFLQSARLQPRTRVLAFHDAQRQVCCLKETYSNMQPVGSGGLSGKQGLKTQHILNIPVGSSYTVGTNHSNNPAMRLHQAMILEQAQWRTLRMQSEN